MRQQHEQEHHLDARGLPQPLAGAPARNTLKAMNKGALLLLTCSPEGRQVDLQAMRAAGPSPQVGAHEEQADRLVHGLRKRLA